MHHLLEGHLLHNRKPFMNAISKISKVPTVATED